MAKYGSIDLAFVQRVIDAGLPEDQELEYKRELPKKVIDHSRASQSRIDPLQEFAKDVCAMANSSGGVLLYGVAEDNETKNPTLYPITDEHYDQAQVRLHSILDSLIEPRLMGVTFEPIDVEGGYVLAVKVPGSLAGPHWHGNPEKRRFSVRRGARVSEFTYQELRSAFDRNASATTRARQWINDRLAAVKANKTWLPMSPGPITVVHVIPMLSYYQEGTSIDLHAAQAVSAKFPRPWQGNHETLINFDGVMAYQRSREEEDELFGYTQLFRDGSFEVVMCARHYWTNEHEDQVVGAGPVAWTVHDTFTYAPPVIRELGKDGPLLLGVSVLNTHDYALPHLGRHLGRHTSDREDLIVPSIYLEDAEHANELERAAQSALDMIWQGFGYGACLYYDKQGNYLGDL
jgi:hypothetical protein